jgi:2,3,4,5-tetrahydropyridine-2,6-dicarboxylate N-succinyltransferase
MMTTILTLQQHIEQAFAELPTIRNTADTAAAVAEIIALLNAGTLTVVIKHADIWLTQQWVKKAILLYFKLQQNQIIAAQFTNFYDKIPLKFNNYTEQDFMQQQLRVAPTAIVRYGAYIANNVVLMPSYVNIGAYIGSGSMIDTWATIGSCATIGKNVHISGGVGIGGVLEPIQHNPTIIEDNCFIGARSEIAEGVIVRTGAVIGMGVFIGQSTKIYNRNTGIISTGEIPPYSVVVAGSIPSIDKSHAIYAAIIVKQVDANTRAKTSINELLRS